MQTVHTHRASVHQAAKLVAALLRVAGVTAGLTECNRQPTAGFMTHTTYRLTAKNRDQLRNPTLNNRVWAIFTFLHHQTALQHMQWRTSSSRASWYNTLMHSSITTDSSRSICLKCDSRLRPNTGRFARHSVTRTTHTAVWPHTRLTDRCQHTRTYVHTAWDCQKIRHKISQVFW